LPFLLPNDNARRHHGFAERHRAIPAAHKKRAEIAGAVGDEVEEGWKHRSTLQITGHSQTRYDFARWQILVLNRSKHHIAGSKKVVPKNGIFSYFSPQWQQIHEIFHCVGPPRILPTEGERSSLALSRVARQAIRQNNSSSNPFSVSQMSGATLKSAKRIPGFRITDRKTFK